MNPSYNLNDANTYITLHHEMLHALIDAQGIKQQGSLTETRKDLQGKYHKNIINLNEYQVIGKKYKTGVKIHHTDGSISNQNPTIFTENQARKELLAEARADKLDSPLASYLPLRAENKTTKEIMNLAADSDDWEHNFSKNLPASASYSEYMIIHRNKIFKFTPDAYNHFKIYQADPDKIFFSAADWEHFKKKYFSPSPTGNIAIIKRDKYDPAKILCSEKYNLMLPVNADKNYRNSFLYALLQYDINVVHEKNSYITAIYEH